jgi:hypothetical protein
MTKKKKRENHCDGAAKKEGRYGRALNAGALYTMRPHSPPNFSLRLPFKKRPLPICASL